jgi:putative endonuclease
LLAEGVTLLERNFACRHGEIDLIGLLDNCVLFVEVRQRKKAAMVSAIESITAKKIQRINRTARYYLHIKQLEFHYARVDLLAWDGAPSDSNPPQWLKNITA